MDLLDGPDDFLDTDTDVSQVPADVAGLLQRLQSDSLDDVAIAVTEIAAERLAAVQDDVARLLLAAKWCAESGLVDAILDYLAEHGDGRCVRPMEEALHENGRSLTEHQAWRARHIVQKIRRFGRK